MINRKVKIVSGIKRSTAIPNPKQNSISPHSRLILKPLSHFATSYILSYAEKFFSLLLDILVLGGKIRKGGTYGSIAQLG